MVRGGGEASAIQADVSSRDDAARLFAALEERMGFPSYLVNNAGLTRDGALMLISDAHWAEVLDTSSAAPTSARNWLCAV